MLVALFRSNKPYIIILPPLISIPLWAFSGFDLASVQPPYPMPFYRMLFPYIEQVPFLAGILGFLLLIIGALLLNNLVAKFQILSTDSHMPALVYTIMMSATPSLLTLHPILFVNLFSILILNRLYDAYRKNNVFTQVFDVGLFAGIASLFYFPAIVLYLFILITLTIIRPVIWREWAISFVGLTVPYFFVGVYFFWMDLLGIQANSFSTFLFIEGVPKLEVDTTHLFLIITTSFVSLFAAKKYFQEITTLVVKGKKMLIILIWMFIVTLLSLLLAPSLSIVYFSLAAVPFSIYLSNYILNIQNKLVSELVFFLLLTSIVYTHIVNL